MPSEGRTINSLPKPVVDQTNLSVNETIHTGDSQHRAQSAHTGDRQYRIASIHTSDKQHHASSIRNITDASNRESRGDHNTGASHSNVNSTVKGPDIFIGATRKPVLSYYLSNIDKQSTYSGFKNF